MDVTDIIKESLRYPIDNDNIKNFLIICGIFLVISLVESVAYLEDVNMGAIVLIAVIVYIIGVIFISGYYLTLSESTLAGSNILPDIDLSKNMLYGLKNFAVSLIYAIPLIILLVLVILTSASIVYSTYYTYSNVSSSSSIILLILMILLIIYSIFMVFFLPISQVRLAETNSISQALSIGFIFNKISQIGWGRCLVLYILSAVVVFILYFIYGLIMQIPTIGEIIGFIIMVFLPVYIQMFIYRSVALLYKDTLMQNNMQNPQNPYYSQNQINYNQPPNNNSQPQDYNSQAQYNNYQQYPNNPQNNNQNMDNDSLDFNPRNDDN